jgi:hypothetical protein
MNVVAKQPPLTDDAIEEFLAFIGKCLDRDEAFTVLWHVKGGAFPSMKQFRRVLSWLAADGHAEAWDANVQGNVAVIRSPLLRGVARLMTSISKPPQPSYVTSDTEDALKFTQENLQEARNWLEE